jgi:hypothetical protein
MMRIARLECGCAVSGIDDEGGEGLALWLYHVIGNGWQIEEVPDGTAIEYDCPSCKQALPLTQKTLF